MPQVLQNSLQHHFQAQYKNNYQMLHNQEGSKVLSKALSDMKLQHRTNILEESIMAIIDVGVEFPQ